jgi:hypothetical protein
MNRSSSQSSAERLSGESLRFAILAAILALVGCGRDPLGTIYTSQTPKVADLVGTYVAEADTVSAVFGGNRVTASISLRPNGELTISGMKDLGLTQIDGSKVAGDGVHGKMGLGRNDENWIILVEGVEIWIVRDQAPYGLELICGKNGWERALRFERSRAAPPP